MIERLRNVYNAVIGHKATCGGNCTCHTVGSELGDVQPEVTKGVGDSIDLSTLHPDIADMIRELVSPEKQDELLEAMVAHDAPSAPSECVHLDYIPVCHCTDNDAKPDWCSASKCPVRKYQVIVEQMRKHAAMIAYG